MVVRIERAMGAGAISVAPGPVNSDRPPLRFCELICLIFSAMPWPVTLICDCPRINLLYVDVATDARPFMAGQCIVGFSHAAHCTPVH